MTDSEQSTSGMVPGLVQGLIAQLRGITEGLEGLARFGEHLPSADGVLPLPGTLSAAQLRSIADSIGAQRRSIEALKAQLSSFDEQLAVLEQILGPRPTLSSRSSSSANLLLHCASGPKTKGRASGSDRD